MDTKSKKWKIVVSFLSFAVGISLLLECGLSLCYRLLTGNLEFTNDYQNTSQFRQCMERYLEDFLAVASDGTLGWYDSVYGDAYLTEGYYPEYWETAYSTGSISAETDNTFAAEPGVPYDVVQETVTDNTASYDSELSEEERAKLLEEQKKKAGQYTKNYMQNLMQNQNLLFRISCDGKEIYSNLGSLVWNGPDEPLPDHSPYSFMLHFDGEKVIMQKDAMYIDVYGDGYYKDESDWYVPGYQNFAADDKLKKADVVILAAKNPTEYNNSVYGSSHYNTAINDLYYLALDVKTDYNRLLQSLTGFFAGVVLTFFAWLLRKEKRKADIWLGKITGKIWIEWKILFSLSILLLFCYFAVNRYRIYGTGAFTELCYEAAYSETVPAGFFLNLGAALLQCAVSFSGFLIIFFWLIYLGINDIRRNRGHVSRGFIRLFAERFETKNLKESFSKRMVRRFFLIFTAGAFVIFLLSAAVYGLYFTLANRIDPVIILCLAVGIIVLWSIFGIAGFQYLTIIKNQAKELDLLAGQIERIHNGDYKSGNDTSACHELKTLALQLSDIRQGMESAIEERMKSEHMKVELVANVSHDIKTPLTSIISYVQFLKQEENLPDHVKDYIRILDEKSNRLNHMVQDIFAVSKAVSGQLPMQMKRLDFSKLLRQTLADMEAQIEKASVVFKAEIPEHEIIIYADGDRMYRVFQNLIVNALKYSLEGSRVFLTLREDTKSAEASIKNISRRELSNEKDFTGRFVRGDESRTDGGSGLGLSIAKSFTEACGGKFILETDADLFVVKIIFEKHTEPAS